MLVVSVLKSDPQASLYKGLIVNMLIIGHQLNSSGAALQCIHQWWNGIHAQPLVTAEIHVYALMWSLTFLEEPGPHWPSHRWLCGFASPLSKMLHHDVFGPQMCWWLGWRSPLCIAPMRWSASGTQCRDGHCSSSPPAENWCWGTGFHLRNDFIKTLVNVLAIL